MIKGKDLRQAENRLTILPLGRSNSRREKWVVAQGSSSRSLVVFCPVEIERKNNCERRQPKTISSVLVFIPGTPEGTSTVNRDLNRASRSLPDRIVEGHNA